MFSSSLIYRQTTNQASKCWINEDPGEGPHVRTHSRIWGCFNVVHELYSSIFLHCKKPGEGLWNWVTLRSLQPKPLCDSMTSPSLGTEGTGKSPVQIEYWTSHSPITCLKWHRFEAITPLEWSWGSRNGVTEVLPLICINAFLPVFEWY